MATTKNTRAKLPSKPTTSTRTAGRHLKQVTGGRSKVTTGENATPKRASSCQLRVIDVDPGDRQLEYQSEDGRTNTVCFRVVTDEFDRPDASSKGPIRRGDTLVMYWKVRPRAGDLVICERHRLPHRLVWWKQGQAKADFLRQKESVYGPVLMIKHYETSTPGAKTEAERVRGLSLPIVDRLFQGDQNTDWSDDALPFIKEVGHGQLMWIDPEQRQGEDHEDYLERCSQYGMRSAAAFLIFVARNGSRSYNLANIAGGFPIPLSYAAMNFLLHIQRVLWFYGQHVSALQIAEDVEDEILESSRLAAVSNAGDAAMKASSAKATS